MFPFYDDPYFLLRTCSEFIAQCLHFPWNILIVRHTTCQRAVTKLRGVVIVRLPARGCHCSATKNIWTWSTVLLDMLAVLLDGMALLNSVDAVWVRCQLILQGVPDANRTFLTKCPAHKHTSYVPRLLMLSSVHARASLSSSFIRLPQLYKGYL